MEGGRSSSVLLIDTTVWRSQVIPNVGLGEVGSRIAMANWLPRVSPKAYNDQADTDLRRSNNIPIV